MSAEQQQQPRCTVWDTLDYGRFVLVEGDDGRWYNFFGRRSLNAAQTEIALANAKSTMGCREIIMWEIPFDAEIRW